MTDKAREEFEVWFDSEVIPHALKTLKDAMFIAWQHQQAEIERLRKQLDKAHEQLHLAGVKQALQGQGE